MDEVSEGVRAWKLLALKDVLRCVGSRATQPTVLYCIYGNCREWVSKVLITRKKTFVTMVKGVHWTRRGDHFAMCYVVHPKLL